MHSKYCKIVYDGVDLTVPEEMGKAKDNQLKGSDRDNLTELCGRVCYDSLGTGRSSDEYHKHIVEVGHGSVQEHANLTFVCKDLRLNDCLILREALANRPGVWSIREASSTSLFNLRITTNLRSLREWRRFPICERENKFSDALGSKLRLLAKPLAPLVLFDVNEEPSKDLNIKVASPKHDDEIWVSFFMTNVSRGLCYDDQTEVLTKDGWKLFKDTNKNDLFATLNVNTEELEYQRSIGSTVESWNGKMYKLKSTMVDLVVTPNHRMFVRKRDTQEARRKEEPWGFYKAEDIMGKRVFYKKNAKWIGESQEIFKLPDVCVKRRWGMTKLVGEILPMKMFLRFLGYWMSEGYLDHTKDSSYSICLTQNVGDILDDMVSTVKHLGFKPNVRNNKGSEKAKKIRFCCQSLYNYLEKTCGKTSITKKVPSFIKELTPSLIKEFLNPYINGDGNKHIKNNHEVIYTSSKDVADELQILILKAGLSASIRVDDRVGVSRIGKWSSIKQTVPNYIVSIAQATSQMPLVNCGYKKDGTRTKHDSMIDYNGIVYCVTVPNETLYVRRNGIPVWCGNTHELVRHGDWTAISQRSTRYVEECESPWAWHPLINRWLEDDNKDLPIAKDLQTCVELCQKTYGSLRKYLEYYLEDTLRMDKFTARKQARGAARGVLGNALMTELIFSANLAQWKRMILMRASNYADAEIRLLFNDIFDALREKYPDRFENWKKTTANDSMGFDVGK